MDRTILEWVSNEFPLSRGPMAGPHRGVHPK